MFFKNSKILCIFSLYKKKTFNPPIFINKNFSSEIKSLWLYNYIVCFIKLTETNQEYPIVIKYNIFCPPESSILYSNTVLKISWFLVYKTKSDSDMVWASKVKNNLHTQTLINIICIRQTKSESKINIVVQLPSYI